VFRTFFSERETRDILVLVFFFSRSVFFRFFARLFPRSSPVTKPSQPNQSYRLGVAELRVPYWPEATEREKRDDRTDKKQEAL
jgi:hypothetical protein